MLSNIIEAHAEGKISQERCEDIIHVSDDFVAVIDGATSFLRYSNGKTPGRAIAEAIDRAIGTLASDLNCREFLVALNERVSKELSLRWPESEEKPTASLIVYSAIHSEVWILGDGWVSSGGRTHRFTIPFADAYTFVRCVYLQSLIHQGKLLRDLLEHDPSTALLLPFIKAQKNIQNVLPEPYGYGVFDGGMSCVNYVKALKICKGDEVILASDGYPAVLCTLEETERRLREVIDEDPLMISICPQVKGVMIGQKSFDDRSYVRFVGR